MKKLFLFILLITSILPLYAAQQIETIVIMRHGEKPFLGIGQLNCKGLNRALLLAKVLMAKYGKPDIIYAPDPKAALFEGTGIFNYVRPLATIEPLAIQLNMPVNTHYGYAEIDSLAMEVLQPEFHQSLVFISWEHFKAYLMARKIMSLTGGDPWAIPFWHGGDYDSLYVINIDWTRTPQKVSFVHDYQGLDGQGNTCPANHDLIKPTTVNNHADNHVERFIFIPEAEAQKPERGQLSCQGLNRALHLTRRLQRLYPDINKYFAADPIDPVYADGQPHYYQRAVMTIEPATIAAGEPIHTPYGYKDTQAMAMYLLDEDYENKTLAIAWPRKEMVELVESIYQAVGGNVLDIPQDLPDTDSMYVITVTRSENTSKSSFAIVAENLNNQNTVCPAAI